VHSRELEHHEKLYSGFAQKHFAKPAVRALRAYMVRRILRVTGAGRNSAVLSLVDILRRMEHHQYKKRSLYRKLSLGLPVSELPPPGPG